MNDKRIQFTFSLIFLLAYLALIFVVLYLETQGSFTNEGKQGSMLGELKILIGVLTAGVAQILNFWFGSHRKPPKTGHKNSEVKDDKEEH